ncbi:hypothetical protein F8S13_01145 [Chloroflexia bacterium SDU3-3]|nr:hypothetical protein F8S13_01145 [Chloroflexia bacterium SDU3-3]
MIAPNQAHLHHTTTRSHLAQAALLILALIPPLYVIILILTLTVDVPFADQWALVPLLQHAYQGRLNLGELWAQHNEHRLLFPRLLMLGLAWLTGWSTRAEMLANVALASATCGLLLWQVRASARRAGGAAPALAPILSLMIFSLGQSENWWGGWNIQIFLNVLGACAAILLLGAGEQRWGRLLLAAGCSVVASFSYSNGLLLWPLGAALLAAGGGWRRGQRRYLAAWLACGAATVGAFFHGYSWTSQTPSADAVLGQIGSYAGYALTYLGAPPVRGAVELVFSLATGDHRAICNLGDSDLCSYVNTAAIGAGLAGLALLPLAAWLAARAIGWRGLLPYLGLALYALGTGASTSLGRASYGMHQAMAQRYATTATLFWVALVALLALGGRHAGRAWARTACYSIVGVIAAATLLCTIKGIDHFRWQYEFLAPARQALATLDDEAMLQRLFFDTGVVRQGAAVLREYHLSIFR